MPQSVPQHPLFLLSLKFGLAVLLLVCLAGTGFAQLDLLYINANIGDCPTCAPDSNQVLAYNLNTKTGVLTRILGPFTTGGPEFIVNTPATRLTRISR